MQVLDYTDHINRHMCQNTIKSNTINDYGSDFTLNTSNEYTLQGVYNAKSYLGTITSLQQVCLAIYDTDLIPFPYTGSEHIGITDNTISLNLSKRNKQRNRFKSKGILWCCV